MPTKKKRPVAKKPSIVRVNEGEDIPVVYANNVQVEISNWDVKLRFGQVEKIDGSEFHVRERSHVYMSHAHARSFLAVLAGVLAKLDAESRRDSDDRQLVVSGARRGIESRMR